ncbi:alpha/beta hydrolase [uncultured Sulfitobacter sp.]|uniref:alpha/beta hydrolase n=1 Tax=uncultured Sulfitobacter sp. TaxID=191468 RepID=UPI0026105707|nr:alpha/beta hydrolase [uncultured Sulfitobacter sp.]
MLKPIRDWDDAFANMAHVAGSEKLPQLWTERAAAFRASDVRLEQDIPYGSRLREKFDLVWPDDTPKGLVVFIHGGFWMRLDKSFWTNFAEGARAQGWAVCIPSYTLAPEARIGHITTQIAAAIEAAALRVEGPIRIAGHSAGGHLATRMICEDTALTANTLARIKAIQSISGLHDLRPLMQTKMNEVLHLDEEEAKLESAVLHRPARAIPYTCWVGGGERPEFIRQSELMVHMWQGLDTPSRCVIDDQHNHFTVLEGLCESDSAITKNLLE